MNRHPNRIYVVIILTALLFFLSSTHAQPKPELDSLKHVFKRSKNIVDSVSVINQLIWKTYNTSPDETYKYGLKALQLSSKISNSKLRNETYIAVALAYQAKEHFESSKTYYLRALSISKQTIDIPKIAQINYSLALLAKQQTRPDEILKYATESKLRFRQLNDINMVIECDLLLQYSNRAPINAFVDSTISDCKLVISTTKDPIVLLKRYHDLICAYGQQSNIASSMFYVMKMLDLSERINNPRALASSYKRIADYFRDYQSNHEVALLYYNKLLELYTNDKIDVGIANTLIDIGLTNIFLDKDTLASAYLNKGLVLALKTKHRHTIADGYKGLGDLSYKRKDYTATLSNYKKSYEIGCNVCPRLVFHKVLINIGNVYLTKGDYNNASYYLNKSLRLADSSYAIKERAASLSALGYYEELTNNVDKAIYFYKNALNNAEFANSLSLKKEIYIKLSRVYQNKQDYQKAFDYLTRYNIAGDSLDKITQIENVSKLESKFELQNLKIQKELELKESSIRAQAEIDKQTQLKYFFVIAFLLTSLIGFILYRGFKQKKKDNSALELQKKQLEEMSAIIHQSDEDKISFFTNISHELKTPLSLILGPTDKLMIEHQGNEKISYPLSVIRKNALQLYDYINQLLSLRKLESGKETLRVSCVDIISLVKGTCTSFSHSAVDKNIILSFITTEKEITGWVDKSILEKTINNLLSNALKFTENGGDIDVSLCSIKTQNEITDIKISVADSGEGIPEIQLDRIFDKYYQVENVNSDNTNGTGLGLAYTKEMIELHRGKITAESKLKLGSIFTVTLPVHESFYTANEKNPGIEFIKEPIDLLTTGYSPDDKLTMLIIEDNTDMRDFIKSIFENEYTIHPAEDGTTGFKIAEELIPDIIISDIMMPGMNGLELCKLLKKNINTNHIPLLLLTAKAGDHNEIEGFSTGADDFLAKPFNSEILRIRVNRLIESRERLKQYFTKEFLLNPSEVKTSSPEDEFLQKAVKIVETNIVNPNLNVDLLMEELGVSRTQLFRKLKAITNSSANQFIRNIKLKRAAQLLCQDSYNVSEVLYLSGFNSHSYFTACFKELYGCLPKEYHSKFLNTSVMQI